MESNTESLTGSITLIKESNITNSLIADNNIERQIVVHGKTYNLECIIEIPLDKNMVGGVAPRIINNSFIPFVYQIIGELMIAGQDVAARTNDLSNAIQANLNAPGGGANITVRVNRNADRMCLNIYTAPGVQNSHLSLWVNRQGNFQSGIDAAGNYIPGCTHFKLDIGGGGAGGGGGG